MNEATEKEGKRLFYTLLIRQLLDEADNDMKSCADRCRDWHNYSYDIRAESHKCFFFLNSFKTLFHSLK